jgi:hypothetical protein
MRLYTPCNLILDGGPNLGLPQFSRDTFFLMSVTSDVQHLDSWNWWHLTAKEWRYMVITIDECFCGNSLREKIAKTDEWMQSLMLDCSTSSLMLDSHDRLLFSLLCAVAARIGSLGPWARALTTPCCIQCACWRATSSIVPPRVVQH